MARQQVNLNSVFRGYPKNNLIDGDYTTQAATNFGTANHMNVLIPPRTRVGYVAIHYVQPAYVGEIEVYVRPNNRGYYDDESQKCGQANALDQPSPLVFWCGYASENSNMGRYVGVKMANGAEGSYFVLSEMDIYRNDETRR